MKDMYIRHLFRAAVRACTYMALLAPVLLAALVARAAIISTGDVNPPFALIDTPGSTKNFTMPVNPSSTNGGVYVGDINPGRLDIDNGWTLNSTFGVVANQSTASASELFISAASQWNIRIDPANPVFVAPDFEIGRGGTAVARVDLDSTLSVEWQTRLGTLVGANGQLHLGARSALSTGSLVVGAGGAGTLTAGLSTINAGFIGVGSEVHSNGVVTLSGATVNSEAGVILGNRGSGSLNALNGSTITSHFFDLGRDDDFPDGPSPSATSNGTATLSGPQTTWQNDASVIVALNTRGSLTIENGATLTTGWLEVSRWGNDGNVTVNNATLTMAKNASFIETPSLIIGTTPGSAGAASFTGANTAVTVADGGFLEVARGSAESSLNVSGGADVSTHHSIIATEVASVGVVNIGGAGSTWTGSGFFEIGRFGQGTLNVFDGATLASDTGHIAVADTSLDSSANLTGLGSRWTTARFIVVGEAGTGSLVVKEGAAVDIGDFLSLGNSAGGTGTLNVSGSAIDPKSPGDVVRSTITSAYQLAVGHLGDGFAVVHDGARLVSNKANSPTASSGILGHFPDAAGLLEVHGPGSLWTNDGGVNVGFRGAGTLNIQEGGVVESVDSVLARLPGSTGTVVLTGNDSAWFIQNTLYLGGRPASAVPGDEGTAGPGGTANLSVSTGSYVAIGSRIKTFAAGRIDVSTGGSVTVGEGDPEGAAGALHVYPAGSLSGSGTIDGKLINHGAVAPGNSPGILTVEGDYAQSPGGTLMIEIGGTNKGIHYDALDMSGSAMLGGLLNVSLVNGFIPTAGNSFEILAADLGVTGTFATQVLPALAGGLSWHVVYGANSVLLQVDAAGLLGDYNNNGAVDAADFVLWRKTLGSGIALANDDSPGVGPDDYTRWRANFGRTAGSGAGAHVNVAVPEPTALTMLVAALIGCLIVNTRQSHKLMRS
jgi:T5SS/PEP-CTERM-associated repeat protein